MSKTTHRLFCTAAILTALAAAPAFAADHSAGKSVEAGESSRSLGGIEFRNRNAKAGSGIQADRSVSRSAATDPAALEKAFSMIGRSRDGKEIRLAPGENVLKAIKGEASAGDRRGALDPATTVEPEEGAERSIVGGDNRVRVTNTKSYPYSTIGYLEMTNAKGEVWSCSAALVGPKTILTAGHCLYNHDEEGGWRDGFTFWPAINGENDVPYGGFEYDTAYVFEGFVTNYDGSYDAVWPYDIGLITLQEPIGDSLGWLGYWNYADLGDFKGNLVGYHGDKTAFTMWRSACTILAEGITDYDFAHDCDFEWGADGAPIYLYDQEAKARVVVGVNVGTDGDSNWALRLYQPVFEWIQSINQ